MPILRKEVREARIEQQIQSFREKIEKAQVRIVELEQEKLRLQEENGELKQEQRAAFLKFLTKEMRGVSFEEMAGALLNFRDRFASVPEEHKVNMRAMGKTMLEQYAPKPRKKNGESNDEGQGGAPAAAVPVQEPCEEAALSEDANDGHDQSSAAPAEEAVGFLSDGEDLDAEAGSFMLSSTAVEDEGW